MMTFAATGTDLIDLVAILLGTERAAVAEGLWIGLGLSIIYLVVLLGTSWGEKHALLKALVFSLLIHVFSVLGWDAVAPSSITTKESETAEQEPAERFEMLVFSDEARELPQPGAADGIWQQPPAPLDAELARLDRAPTDPLATGLPARQAGPLPDAAAPPNISLLPDPTTPEPPAERETQDTPYTVAKTAPVPLPQPERLEAPVKPTQSQRSAVDRQTAARDPLQPESPARNANTPMPTPAVPDVTLPPEQQPVNPPVQDNAATIARNAVPSALPNPQPLDQTPPEPTPSKASRQQPERPPFAPSSPARNVADAAPDAGVLPDLTVLPYEPDFIAPRAARPTPDSVALTAPLPPQQPDRIEPDTPARRPRRNRLDTAERPVLTADRPDRTRRDVPQDTPEIAVAGRVPERPADVPKADRVASYDGASAPPTPRVTVPVPQYRPDGLPAATPAPSGPPLRTAATDRPAALNTAIDRPAASAVPMPTPDVTLDPSVRPQPSKLPPVAITRTEPQPRSPSGSASGPESNVPTPEIVATVDRGPKPQATAAAPRRTLPDARTTDAFAPALPVRVARTSTGGAPSLPEVAVPDGLASLVPQPTPDVAPRPERPPTYRYREPVERQRAVENFGGNAESERAVEAALKWLAENQSAAGYWDADAFGAGNVPIDENGFDTRGAPVRGGIPGVHADSGVTALALLAFLGAGYTSEGGPYADNVGRAQRWLVNQQRADGYLGGQATHYAQMYCHAMASYALAEAYAMRSNPKAPSPLRQPLQQAIGYILDQQNQTDGGWRYQKGQTSDMSIFGWNLMALKSAEIAGLEVPAPARQRMIDFLIDRSLGEHGGLAAYHVDPKIPDGTKPTPTMTAEALFCKQMLGQKKENPASREAVTFLLDHLPRRTEYDMYYWYYGTLAMYQYGGAGWHRWNDSLRDLLVKDQEQKGPLAGSWDPKGRWGGYGGRVYSTAMGALSLEVYYRFLPLYKAQQPGS